MIKTSGFQLAINDSINSLLESQGKATATYYLNKLQKSKEEAFSKSYERALNACFSEKPQLIKFDSSSTDEEIDRFFDSI